MSLIWLSLTLIIALIFGFELLSVLLSSRVLDTDVLVLLSLLFLSFLSSLFARDHLTYRALETHRMTLSQSGRRLDYLLSRLSIYSLLFLCYFLTSLLLILLMRDTTLSRFFLIGALLSFFPLALSPILRSFFSPR